MPEKICQAGKPYQKIAKAEQTTYHGTEFLKVNWLVRKCASETGF